MFKFILMLVLSCVFACGQHGSVDIHEHIYNNDSEIECFILCPDITGRYKESLCYIDGELYAYFQRGEQGFWSLLEDGEYKSTDGRNCYFSVENNEVYYE